MHILFVEDEIHLAKIKQTMLEQRGYQVTLAYNGVEALKFIELHWQKLDLVITDYSMPFMNGKQLTQKLSHIAPHLPIILSTGNLEITPTTLQAWGASALLRKPYTQQELENLIQHLLDQ